MRRVVLGVVLVGVIAAPVIASSPARVLWIRNVGTGEELRLRPFRERGQLELGAWRRLDRLFGRGGGRVRRTIHPRLVRTLAHVQSHFGGRQIELRSAYRTSDRWQWDSYHQVGRAIDFRVAGVANRELFEYCLALQRQGEPLGCGYYPHGRHVHLDVRGHRAVWVDASPGWGPPRYVSDPHDWLRRHPNG